jgi:hypothetical protein
MGKVNADRAEKVGDFLFRYMRARHRFKEKVEGPLPRSQLATLIADAIDSGDQNKPAGNALALNRRHGDPLRLRVFQAISSRASIDREPTIYGFVSHGTYPYD